MIKRTKNIREAHVNDIVLVYIDKTPRSRWKSGKVLEVINSNDRKIRGAIELTKTSGTEHLTRSPINRLYPLECDKMDEGVKIRFVDDANIKMMQKTDT